VDFDRVLRGLLSSNGFFLRADGSQMSEAEIQAVELSFDEVRDNIAQAFGWPPTKRELEHVETFLELVWPEVLLGRKQRRSARDIIRLGVEARSAKAARKLKRGRGFVVGYRKSNPGVSDRKVAEAMARSFRIPLGTARDRLRRLKKTR
jgi:hypothetical protein